jgi:tight adherence protein C
MTYFLPWLVCLACLLTGGVLLAQGLSAYAAAQIVMQRLRRHVSCPVATPWPVRKCRSLAQAIRQVITDSNTIHLLQGELLGAGFGSAVAPVLFYLSRLMACLAGVGLVLVPDYLRHGAVASKSVALSSFLSVFIYRGFNLFLSARTKARQREIRREFPYVLDLLLMVLDSGVSVDQALGHVSQHIGHVAPLSAVELTHYIADVEEGMPYDKALDRLGQRWAIREGHDFAALLKQNLFQGGELSPPLRLLATDISEARLAYAREQLGQKSVLLTLVTLGFFMPVLLMAVAGPAISDIVGTLSHVAQDLQNSRGKR